MATKQTPYLLGILTALALIVVACGGSASGGAAGDDRRFELAPIESLELIVRDTLPRHYAVRITSGLPGSCAQFVDASVLSEDGETITIRVRNSMPTDPDVVCAAIYGTHEEIVELGAAELRAGTTYTVQANDKTLTFTTE